MEEPNSKDNYEAKTLILNDSNDNELFCYLEQLVNIEGEEYALSVSYTHLTLPTIYSV